MRGKLPLIHLALKFENEHWISSYKVMHVNTSSEILAKFINSIDSVAGIHSAFDCFKGIIGTAISKSTTTFSGSHFVVNIHANFRDLVYNSHRIYTLFINFAKYKETYADYLVIAAMLEWEWFVHKYM